MSLPSYQTAMLGYTTEGLTAAEAKGKRLPNWNWKLGSKLVGRYLEGKDLLECSLVSKKFHEHFTALLWSDPISILKSKKRPAFELYHFMYWVHNIPIGLRDLVRTLDFHQILRSSRGPRVQSPREKQMFDVMYNAAWLLYCTKLFRFVRFVTMDSLPGLPYNAVDLAEADDPAGLFATQAPISNAPIARARVPTEQIAQDAISHGSTSNDPIFNIASDTADDPVSFAVGSEIQDVQELQAVYVHMVKMKPLLFSANGPSRCVLLDELITSNLIYLDLSYTKGNSDAHVRGMTTFLNVRILKLRGCRMADSELKKWLPIHRKLWCLDVRDNLLTDASVYYILSNLMLDRTHPPKSNTDGLSDQHLYEDTPQYERDDDVERTSTITPTRPFEKQDFINCVERHAAFASIHDQPLDGNDPLLRLTGLTHLFVSNNKLSSHGVKLFLTPANRLQHLDVGSVQASNSSKFYVPYTNVYAQLNSKSAGGLSRRSGSHMKVLRIHHSIVTYVPSIINVGSRNDGFTLPLVKEAENRASNQRVTMMKKTPPQEGFSPLQNFRVSELVLTGIPTKSYGYIIDRLTDLLHDCALQEWDLNMAREQTPTNRRSPELLSGLRKIFLEFIPQDTSAQSPSGGSVSGDRDADNFLASSEGDFSFFPQNTMSSASRRSSVAASSGNAVSPSTPASRKGSIVGSTALQRQVSGLSSRPGSSTSAADPPPYGTEKPVLDVAQELKKYRAEHSEKWTGTLRLMYPTGH